MAPNFQSLNRYNSPPAYSSISLKFDTAFAHVTPMHYKRSKSKG